MIIKGIYYFYDMLVSRKVFFCLTDILPPFFIQFAFADEIEEIQDIFLSNMFKLAMRQQCLEKSFKLACFSHFLLFELDKIIHRPPLAGPVC